MVNEYTVINLDTTNPSSLHCSTVEIIFDYINEVLTDVDHFRNFKNNAPQRCVKHTFNIKCN